MNHDATNLLRCILGEQIHPDSPLAFSFRPPAPGDTKVRLQFRGTVEVESFVDFDEQELLRLSKHDLLYVIRDRLARAVVAATERYARQRVEKLDRD